MRHLSMLNVILRERFGTRQVNREPEPELIMESDASVQAFAMGGEEGGALAGLYLFNAGRISQTLHGCRHVIDLGCGPARQLSLVAQINPHIRFTGVDLSAPMLGAARTKVQAMGLKNVDFQTGDISDLSFLADNSVDGVISTVTLHHLRNLEELNHCFSEIRRVLRKDGRIYLIDFTRLKRLRSVHFFAHLHEDHQPEQLIKDSEASLKAAFLLKEFQSLAKTHFTGHKAEVFTTWQVPYFVIIKTPGQPLHPETKKELQTLKDALNGPPLKDFNDLRLFFRLGGLSDDPFAG